MGKPSRAQQSPERPSFKLALPLPVLPLPKLEYGVRKNCTRNTNAVGTVTTHSVSLVPPLRSGPGYSRKGQAQRAETLVLSPKATSP